MDGEVYGPPRPAYLRVNESVHWSEALGAAIVARVRAGESIRGLGRAEGMPQGPTIQRWLREKPEFAAAVDAARKAAGCPFRGSVSTYCVETAQAIFERLCEGEGLIAICRDPAMPARSTVGRWMAAEPEFRAAIEMARDICADAMVQRGWDWCEAATPETAYLLKVKLGQLRWCAGKLAPKTYGTLKAAEPGEEGAPQVIHLYHKTYIYDLATEEVRDAGEPAVLMQVMGTGANAGVLRTTEAGLTHEQALEDNRRAAAEAGRAAMAAGVVCNGGVEARFWPQWWREKYPDEHRQLEVLDEHRRRQAARAAEKLAALQSRRPGGEEDGGA